MAGLLILGDVHGETERLEKALRLVDDRRFDLALLVGDVGVDPPWLEPERHARRKEHDASVAYVLRTVGEAVEAPVVFVPGNHDLRDPPEVAGATNADGRIVERAGLRIAGLGGAGPASFGFPYEWTEDRADETLSRLLDGPEAERPTADVLLSHTPPANSTLDPTARGVHVGSVSVDKWIERARPRLFVCGHIHEAWGAEVRYGVPCLNAGALGEPHSQVIACTAEWDGGPTRIRVHRPDGDTLVFP